MGSFSSNKIIFFCISKERVTNKSQRKILRNLTENFSSISFKTDIKMQKYSQLFLKNFTSVYRMRQFSLNKSYRFSQFLLKIEKIKSVLIVRAKIDLTQHLQFNKRVTQRVITLI